MALHRGGKWISRRREPASALASSNNQETCRKDLSTGVAALLAACAVNAFAGAAFFHAHRLEPEVPCTAGTFLRVALNLSLLALPLVRREALPRLKPWRGHRSLWLWGLFGVLSVITYYAALPLVGPGVTMFLGAGSGLFVAALAPMLTGQRTCRAEWLGAVGSSLGLYFLCLSGGAGVSLLGAALALISGVTGGVAYLMVARSRRAHSLDTVLLHWTVANLLAYAGFLFFSPPRWPALPATWGALVAGGLAAAAGQYLTAFAYRRAPAALLACLCYLAPVLALALDACLFDFRFGPRALFGAGLVVLFGLAVPLLARGEPVPAPARARNKI